MELLAKDVMSCSVVTVCEQDTVLQCAQLLRDRDITGAPVLDVEQNLVGVISIRDLMPERAEEDYGFYDPVDIKAEFREGGVARIVGGERPVKELMASHVVSCGPETPLEDLAEIARSRHQSHSGGRSGQGVRYRQHNRYSGVDRKGRDPALSLLAFPTPLDHITYLNSGRTG
jgi:CBS domain-containing protein